MNEPARITSPYAPDVGEVRIYLEKMIRALRFAELVTAILAFVMRMAQINGELSKKLAELHRRRPRSESLKRIERQLALPLAGLGGAAQEARPAREPKSRKGRHPGRAKLPAHCRASRFKTQSHLSCASARCAAPR